MIENQIGFHPEAIEGIMKQFVNVLASGELVDGPYTEAFETRVAEKLNVRHAVACGSVFSALELALKDIRVPGNAPICGKNVLLPIISPPHTLNAIRNAGGLPVFVDVDPVTGFPNQEQIEEAIEEYSPEVFVAYYSSVGFPGQQAAAVINHCKVKGVMVIENASILFGTTYVGTAVGTFGHVGCFDFSTDSVIHSGLGGMLVTNDEESAKRIKRQRNSSRPVFRQGLRLDFPFSGCESRMTELQAVIGISHLLYMDELIKSREESYKLLTEHFYKAKIDSSKVSIIEPRENVESVFNAFYLRVYPDAFDVEEKYKEAIVRSIHNELSYSGVSHGVDKDYDPYCNRLTYGDWLEHSGKERDPWPKTPMVSKFDNIVSLPLFPEMSMPEAYTMMSLLKSAVEEAGKDE